jgi:hypothetical protein
MLCTFTYVNPCSENITYLKFCDDYKKVEVLQAQLNIRMQPRPGSQKGARSAPFASCAEGTTGVGLVYKVR